MQRQSRKESGLIQPILLIQWKEPLIYPHMPKDGFSSLKHWELRAGIKPVDGGDPSLLIEAQYGWYGMACGNNLAHPMVNLSISLSPRVHLNLALIWVHWSYQSKQGRTHVIVTWGLGPRLRCLKLPPPPKNFHSTKTLRHQPLLLSPSLRFPSCTRARKSSRASLRR